ncbi:MAG: NUDIX domain-containing protein [Undibacterium sp.]|uniref:NUDIX hydrolase n=1 Tax=Undibacterium sp. TaxID=1914977 RepID=UPI002726782C|nr:NUDIX domain-containing protein [Undibacterium sp.]MDO8654763.1 NUDIX domain-containing protein [Undibacterium sp.]
MNILRCACLVAVQDDKLLLVRVRENVHWYLPGGKIELGERPEHALQRELLEELGIATDPGTVRYLYTVFGPAYGEPGEVELICFAAEWKGLPQSQGEISDVSWISMQDTAKLAPAVQILCADRLQNANGDSPAYSGRAEQARIVMARFELNPYERP